MLNHAMVTLSLRCLTSFEWSHSLLLRVANHFVYGNCYVCFYSINDYPVSRKWNDCFLGLRYFENQLFSEGKLYSSTSLISTTALHIEIISLVDGTYELIEEPDEDISEAQVNVTEDNEDLNMNPKFENELHEVQPISWN